MIYNFLFLWLNYFALKTLYSRLHALNFNCDFTNNIPSDKLSRISTKGNPHNCPKLSVILLNKHYDSPDTDSNFPLLRLPCVQQPEIDFALM